MPFLDDALFSSLNLVCRMGGYFVAPANSNWKLSKTIFEQNKFYYITEGSCHIRVLDRHYITQPGDWFFLPSELEHGYSSHTELPLKKFWMHFDLYPLDFLTNFVELPVMVHVPLSRRKEVETCFQEFSENFHASDVTHTLVAKAAGLKLFAIYLDLAFPGSLSTLQAPPDDLMSLLAYIQQNLNLPLTNTDLAEIMHLHPTYFCQWFRDRIGVSPQQYVLQSRLEVGKCLLETTEKSINCISREIGFFDSAHFSHAFRRFMGMAPSQYRVYANRDITYRPEDAVYQPEEPVLERKGERKSIKSSRRDK